MRRDRLPSLAELQRMPAGERVPRLRALAAHYTARLAVLEARAPYSHQQGNITSHRRTLDRIDFVLRSCCADQPTAGRNSL